MADQRPPTQLGYLLRQLSTKQRKQLVRKLSVSERTFYRYAKNPRSMPAEHFLIAWKHLEAANGCSYDQVKLMKPLVVTARKPERAAA